MDNKQLKDSLDPLVQMVADSSVDQDKIVISDLKLQPGDGMGPYWNVFVFLDRGSDNGGEGTEVLTFGRFFPDLSETQVRSVLNTIGDVLVFKAPGRFDVNDMKLIYSQFCELLSKKFVNIYLTDPTNPGSFFDKCCEAFPGQVSNNLRKEYVTAAVAANQSKGA